MSPLQSRLCLVAERIINQPAPPSIGPMAAMVPAILPLLLSSLQTMPDCEIRARVREIREYLDWIETGEGDREP